MYRLFILLLILIVSNASAQTTCAVANGVLDVNCDGIVRVCAVGDSIVYGIGDKANNERGGYPLRAAKKLPNVDVINSGEPGLKVSSLLLRYSRDFKSSAGRQEYADLLTSDIIVLDLGRNDRWAFGPASSTYRDLKRLRSLIRSAAREEYSETPLVVIAVLMLPNRGAQGPWVKELNQMILDGNSLANPSDLRFDLISKRLLNEDQIHPTSRGYDDLAKTFIKYLTKTLPARVKKLYPDLVFS